MIFPFGKHKGIEVCDVESSYLIWALESVDNLSTYIKNEIRDELAERLGLRMIPPSKNDKEIRSTYLELCKKYHPDRGGSNEAMQSINEFYEKIR